MNIGIYLATQWPAGADLGPQLGNLLEQVRVARANGFEALWVAHHYLTGPGMQMLQPAPLLGRLLAEAEGMTVGPAILLLPMLSPVAVAEEAATLDWLSDGNYVLAVGMGYRKEEFESLGVPMKQRRGRFVESIEVMRRLWAEDRVTFAGKYYQLNDVGISLKPKRNGGIPIWVGGNVEASIARAGEIGDAWITSFSPTADELRSLSRLYRDSNAASGSPRPPVIALGRECYVGGNGSTALDDVRGPLRYKYEAYASWGTERVRQSSESFAAQFDGFCKDRFVIGDEAQVRDDLARYCDIVRPDHLILRMQWPGLDQATVLKSIERMGRIIPGLR